MHVCELISGFEYEKIQKLTKSARRSNCFEDSANLGSATGAVKQFVLEGSEDDCPSSNIYQ